MYELKNSQSLKETQPQKTRTFVLMMDPHHSCGMTRIVMAEMGYAVLWALYTALKRALATMLNLASPQPLLQWLAQS